MMDENSTARARERKAEVVRLIVTRRERAPRSPRMERAFKQLIWRYCSLAPDNEKIYVSESGTDTGEGSRTPPQAET